MLKSHQTQYYSKLTKKAERKRENFTFPLTTDADNSDLDKKHPF